MNLFSPAVKLSGLWFLISGIACFLLLQACSEKEEVNPFTETRPAQDTVNFQLDNPTPNSIAGLFVNIFHPTCANVACHDGTFEPDFRTIESTYNTMVYQRPVKNDGTYDYRVHPGRPDQSVLMARIHGTISPPMPFQLEPDSDWLQNRDEYIENIRSWIQNGALDVMGNAPVENAPSLPGFKGMLAFQNGVQLVRYNSQGPVLLASEFDTLQLYFALSHNDMDVRHFLENQIRFSGDYDDFSGAGEYQLELLQVGMQGRGIYGDMLEYFHRIVVVPADLELTDSQIFMRLYVKDEHNPITEIPSNQAAYGTKNYLSLLLPD